jgi:hypothetical protein
MMPMVAMPAPVMAMPMMAQANLLRLETVDIGLRDHRGLYALHLRSHESSRRRRQRRGIRNTDKRRSARGHSDRQFQNRTKFHSNLLLLRRESVTTASRYADECALNQTTPMPESAITLMQSRVDEKVPTMMRMSRRHEKHATKMRDCASKNDEH